MTIAAMISAKNRKCAACVILRSPIHTVEGRAEFVSFLFAGELRTEPQGANDNECDDEGGEASEDD